MRNVQSISGMLKVTEPLQRSQRGPDNSKEKEPAAWQKYLSGFEEVWLIAFDYDRPSGENPRPIALKACELWTGQTIEVTPEPDSPPWPVAPSRLFVVYDAASALGCFLALGWRLPPCLLDLQAEFAWHVSGFNDAKDWSFAMAMEFYSAGEVMGVDAIPKPLQLESLLGRMLPYIDLDRALLRGRYAGAVATIERVGIPIDLGTLTRMRANWDGLLDSLIERTDRDYGVFDGRTFKGTRWARWLADHSIPWPCLKSGALALDDDTFKEMARAYSREVGPMWELRKTLNKLRFNKLAIGADGRNRTALRPFTSKTGRNQPSTSRFIFGSAAWVRGLIKPGPGMAIAYVDYEQQEFGIAGALSGDEAMMKAYASGDPYLEFAKQAGAVPADATKATHHEERERFKLCALGIQYGMGAKSLALRLRGNIDQARELIASHKQVYNRYWKWSRSIEKEARERGVVTSAFCWRLNVREDTKAGTIRNFPLQANGAEILRLACCMLVERGIRICAPIHDAVLIEVRADEIDQVASACQEVMTEASRVVLDGFPLRSDKTIVRYPGRYMDQRGIDFWDYIEKMMAGIILGAES